MSPGTGVVLRTSKTGRPLSHLHYHFHFLANTALRTHKLANSMPTFASCLRPLKAWLFQGVAAQKMVCDLCKSLNGDHKETGGTFSQQKLQLTFLYLGVP